MGVIPQKLIHKLNIKWNQIQIQEKKHNYRIESSYKCIIEKETQDEQD